MSGEERWAGEDVGQLNGYGVMERVVWMDSRGWEREVITKDIVMVMHGGGE